jgi:murein L,D-transpeptidase YcbB/YkuD
VDRSDTRQLAPDSGRTRSRIMLAALLLGALAVAYAQPPAQAGGELRTQIEAAVAAAGSPPRASAPDHGAAQALRAAYSGAGAAALWSRDSRPSSQAEVVLRELQRAASYGLEVQDYAPDRIAALSPAPPAVTADTAHLAQFDVKLSLAALRFMSDLHYGRVDPAAAGFKLSATHQPLDLAASLIALARSADVSATIASFEPPFHHYAILKDALARYLSLAAHPQLTHLPAPPAGLKTGGSYAGAAALRSLLLALGDLPPASGAPAAPAVFDADLSSGVRTFQLRHGLTPDGVLGKATFAALTTPLAQRVRQIELTLERWRWLPPFQTPPIIVNIPQFRLFAFRTTEDRVADILQMDVIVGRVFPQMQTPVFEADMRYLVFRPYWDVPYSITNKELLSKIRANPAYLATQHLEIVRGQQDSSPTVAPTPENIEALANGALRLRQLPGEDNALGLVKFIFPNSYNVYLHSTPAHQLFQESRRAFSHGCIRVSDPVALAEHVLKGAPGDWTREKIEATMHEGSSPVRVNLAQPINVLILYGTALATEAGPTMFFDDIYGYDKRLERQLGLAPLH